MVQRIVAAFSFAVLATGLVQLLPSRALAQPTGVQSQATTVPSAPDGTVTLSGGSIAAGVGFVWGDGKLVFGGKQYSFDIHGISVLDVGASGFTAAGVVRNLRRLEDFPGNYVAASAGITVAGGGGVVYLQNQNGVVIQLDSTTQGLRLNIAAEGMGISLK